MVICSWGDELEWHSSVCSMGGNKQGESEKLSSVTLHNHLCAKMFD